MILDSLTLLAFMIALITSVVVMTLAIKQNAELTKENINLRRKMRLMRQENENYYYYDPDIAKEDLWTTK